MKYLTFAFLPCRAEHNWFKLRGSELAAVQSRWVHARGKKVYHFNDSVYSIETRHAVASIYFAGFGSFNQSEKTNIETMTNFPVSPFPNLCYGLCMEAHVIGGALAQS